MYGNKWLNDTQHVNAGHGQELMLNPTNNDAGVVNRLFTAWERNIDCYSSGWQGELLGHCWCELTLSQGNQPCFFWLTFPLGCMEITCWSHVVIGSVWWTLFLENVWLRMFMSGASVYTRFLQILVVLSKVLHWVKRVSMNWPSYTCE